MKLLLTNFHDGDGGGHTTYLLALAAGLAARHEVHVAAPGSSRLFLEAQRLPGVQAHAQAFRHGPGKPLQWWRARRRLHRLLVRLDVDVVHVNGSADHRLALSALRGVQRRPRLVLTKHNSKPVAGLGHWWRARHTDAVIAVSAHTRAMLQASAYARRPLYLVRNGVDTAHFAPWPADAARAQRHAMFDGVDLLLGSCAGTADYKGWLDLARALAMLPAPERARIGVLVCGRPPSKSQRAELAALGVEPHFRFPGLLDDVRPAIAPIDVGFVLSTAVETISFACREMMAMGKPVLVTRYAGLPENVTPGTDGWWVSPGAPGEVAEALAAMLADRARMAAMGVHARARAEREFGLDRFVAATLAVYEGRAPAHAEA